MINTEWIDTIFFESFNYFIGNQELWTMQRAWWRWCKINFNQNILKMTKVLSIEFYTCNHGNCIHCGLFLEFIFEIYFQRLWTFFSWIYWNCWDCGRFLFFNRLAKNLPAFSRFMFSSTIESVIFWCILQWHSIQKNLMPFNELTCIHTCF